MTHALSIGTTVADGPLLVALLVAMVAGTVSFLSPVLPSPRSRVPRLCHRRRGRRRRRRRSRQNAIHGSGRHRPLRARLRCGVHQLRRPLRHARCQPDPAPGPADPHSRDPHDLPGPDVRRRLRRRARLVAHLPARLPTARSGSPAHRYSASYSASAGPPVSDQRSPRSSPSRPQAARPAAAPCCRSPTASVSESRSSWQPSASAAPFERSPSPGRTPAPSCASEAPCSSSSASSKSPGSGPPGWRACGP